MCYRLEEYSSTGRGLGGSRIKLLNESSLSILDMTAADPIDFSIIHDLTRFRQKMAFRITRSVCMYFYPDGNDESFQGFASDLFKLIK